MSSRRLPHDGRLDGVVSILTALGSKDAEMRILGCDLHASQQSIAMLDEETGETAEASLKHEGDAMPDFYAALPRPVVVGALMGLGDEAYGVPTYEAIEERSGVLTSHSLSTSRGHCRSVG